MSFRIFGKGSSNKHDYVQLMDLSQENHKQEMCPRTTPQKKPVVAKHTETERSTKRKKPLTAQERSQRLLSYNPHICNIQ